MFIEIKYYGMADKETKYPAFDLKPKITKFPVNQF